MRLFTVTLPIWDTAIPHQPQSDKNKEITAAWFSSAVFTPAWFWQLTNTLVTDSSVFDTILVSERGGRVTSAYCSATETRPQTVNNPMEKKTTAVTAQSSHPSNAICCCTKMTTEACTPEVKLNTLAGLNAQANYRQSRCKTSTMDAHLVTRWAQTTTNPYFQLIAKSWLVICRSLSRRSDFLNNKQRNVLENFLEFDILSWWAEPIPRKNRGSCQLGHLTQTPEVRDAGEDREVRKHY